MGLFNRLKRLWELSGDKNIRVNPQPTAYHTHDGYNAPLVVGPKLIPEETHNGLELPVEEPKPRGMATVVQDDPLDIFPNEQEPEQQGQVD